MTGEAAAGRPPGTVRWAGRASGWLRGSRGGLLVVALVVGAGSGLGAIAFRYLIYFFTWLATGHVQFGQQGRVGSAHFPVARPGVLRRDPGHRRAGLRAADLPVRPRGPRPRRARGDDRRRRGTAAGSGPRSPRSSRSPPRCASGPAGRSGREGPIVQIGSALASSLGQWVRMPENRLRILVACGAAGGIAATFNAPITGVFFGVEIILREFSIEAIFTVMLSAMIADLVSRQFLGSAPFLSGLPSGIALHHLSSYLLVAALAVVAALLGLAFAKILYATEDLCDRVWKNRPEWARPAAGGIALGLLLLAIPQMYGVGYPVMYKAVGGSYALWFLIVLAAGKIIACSLTIGIGGSGGVFAPSLFIGATSGMAFGEIAGHLLGPAAGQPALYAVVAHGRGVRLRGPGPAHLGGQRRGDDRRLHPHPAGHARRRDRHRHLPRLELRHHLHHQAAAPRHRHRPPAISGPVRGPHRRRRHAPLRGAAHHRSRATRPAGRSGPARCRCPARSPSSAIRRCCSPASPWPRRCASWSSTAATACQCCLPTGSTCKAGSPARTCCRPWPATCAPPGRPPRRHNAPPARPFPAYRPPRGAHPAARLPDPGNHHPRGLAGRRPGTRRHHLAARVDPGHGHGQPHPPRRRPRHHPHPRRPGQPARPRTTEPRVLASA